MKRGETVLCLLLLGSNQGDRKRHFKKAFQELDRLPFSRLLKISPLYETEPLGPTKRPYLNCAVSLKTSLSPMGLLVELKRLEALAGRKPGPRWGPRPLDVDIAFYGSERFRNFWLRIPHYAVGRRAFALAPLSDIAP